MENPEQKPQSKAWLQRLKDESWEAELLVSAIAIYGTFQMFKGIEWVTNLFIDMLPPHQYLIGYFISFMGLLAISILVSMFVIHFFLRAYWVGLVGLNSVFPEYGLEDSAYSEIYTKKILSILPKLKDSVHKVDELCSVIFSAAFTILLTYLYISIFASIYLFLFNLLSDYVPSYLLLIPIGIIGVLIIFQTIFNIIANLKSFKQNEKVQLFFFKVVKLTSIFMLGPLYKSILQVSMTFGSNFKKKKALVGLIIVFLITGMFVAVFQVKKTHILYLVNKNWYFDETEAYAGYYSTKNEHINFLLTPEITSDIVESNTLKVFIPLFNYERKMQKATCNPYTEDPEKSRFEQRKARRLNTLECYHKYHKVLLNGEKVIVDFIRYEHPETNQSGILGYIKLNTALAGKNILTIKKTFDAEQNPEWSIPFQFALK